MKFLLRLTVFATLILLSLNSNGQIPSNYYDAAAGQTGATLKQTLHDITTANHVKLTYDNLWTAYYTTDVYPSPNNTKVWDVYSGDEASNGSYSGTAPYYLIIGTNQDDGDGADEGLHYNREHSIPNSWWGAADQFQYTDLHCLFATDKYVNGKRSDNPYGEVSVPTWTSLNGGKLGPNDISGSGYTGTAFEPIDAFKGDLARAYFYFAVRYKDEISNWVSSYGASTNIDVVFNSSGDFNTWYLNMLYAWHLSDPPSAKEILRNNAIYNTNQKNANPFIDHPEWVCEIWYSGTCSSATTCISENFDGTVTGWYNYGATVNTGQSCSGTNSFLYNAAGNYVITTAVSNPQTFDCNIKRSTNTTAWSVDLQISDPSPASQTSGPWTTIATFGSTVSATCSSITQIDLSGHTGQRYIKLLDTRALGNSDRSIDDIVITCGSPPALEVSPSSLTGFTYVSGNGPSTSKSFILSGTDLSGYTSNITVAAPSNFEVSLSSGSGYSSGVNVQYTSATLNATTIYVRLAASLTAGSYSGAITITGGGDTDGASVSVSGSVTSSGGSNCGNETFTNIGAASSSYLTVNWTGDGGGSWSATSARTDQVINTGDKAICFKGTVTSPSTANGIGDLTITTKFPFADGTMNLPVTVNGSSVGTVPVSTTATTTTILGINISGNVVIVFTSDGTKRPAIDNLSWTCYNSTPSITLSTATINDFAYIVNNGPSTEKTFTVSGINLTANILLSAPTDYEISTTSGSGFGSSLSLTQTGGTVATTTIYVRLKAGLAAGNYNNENISVSSTGATSQTVSCGGTVTTPTISLSASSLTGFSYNVGSGPSSEQTFTAGGTSLTANISLSAPADYEISTISGSGFGSSVTLIQTGGTVSTTTIYVRLKAGLSAGSYNSENITASSAGASSQTVTCNGTVNTPTPTINISTTALSGFSYALGNGPSGEQPFTTSGSNLTANISLSAPADYEISTTTGSGFGTSLTLTQTGGTVSTTTIYVRLKAGLSAGSYNSENITLSSTGASNKTVTCSGTVSSGSATLTVSASTLSGFTYVQGSGPSLVQSYTLSGSGLTSSGNITVTGSTNYEVSSDGATFASFVNFPYASGIITGQPKTVYVRLKTGLPVNTYNGETIANAGGGATTVNATCSGSVTVAGSGCATDLIISEYVEGSSNNKYIEIYNNTGVSVNLANYKLRLFANGSATPTQDIALSGTLNNQTTIVYKNSSATVYGGTCTSNAAVAYNGNDAIALYKVSTSSYVDIFGRIGEDPGTAWTVGANTTLDKTLVRNASVITGVSTNPTSGFPTLATEWTQYNIDVVSNLGTHIMSCDITWVGATSTDWSVATNWNNNVVPTTQDVTIPSSPGNQPQVTSASYCRNLNIKPGARLTINATKTLTVGGNFLIQSDATGTGSFIDLGTLTVTGTTTVQKYIPGGRWWYIGLPISTPINASCFGNISAASNADAHLYYWNEVGHAYSQIMTGSTALRPDLYPVRGYSVKDYTNNINAVFTGTINTGTIGTAINLSYTGGTSSGFNLVCNPYPSAINLNSANITNGSFTPTNLTGSLWYRTNSTFATYNWNTGVGTNGAWGTATGVVPAMQAFWVRTNGTSGGLQLTNASRLHSAQAFYKQEDENNIFRIHISDSDDVDEAVIGFFTDASTGDDLFDSDKMFVSDEDVPQVYTLTSDNTLAAINGQEELQPSEERVIPLGFSTGMAGTFILQATNMDVFNPFIDVYLEDQLTGNFQDLRINDSYSFTSGVASNNNRFMLHFGAMTTGIGIVSAGAISIYAHANSIYINMPATEKGQFELYDLFGKIVNSREIFKGYTKISVDLPLGIYTVKVVSGEHVTTRKVVIE